MFGLTMIHHLFLKELMIITITITIIATIITIVIAKIVNVSTMMFNLVSPIVKYFKYGKKFKINFDFIIRLKFLTVVCYSSFEIRIQIDNWISLP